MGKFEIPEPRKTDRIEDLAAPSKAGVHSSKELLSKLRAEIPNQDPDLADILPTIEVSGADAIPHLFTKTKSAKELLQEAQAETEKMANAQRDRMNALGHAPHNPIHTDRHH